MAIIYLVPPEWAYDSTTQELILRFQDRAAPDDPDSANYQQMYQATLRIPINPAKVDLQKLR